MHSQKKGARAAVAFSKFLKTDLVERWLLINCFNKTPGNGKQLLISFLRSAGKIFDDHFFSIVPMKDVATA